jgi:hypothetical protein
VSQPSRILYCHCAYAKVVPPEIKAAVLDGLAAANVEFDAVPDLCEMAAHGDDRLRELAAAGPLKIAACYPRAVKWLFAAAGAQLPDHSVRVWNMRVESADVVIDGLLDRSSDAAGADHDAAARDTVGAPAAVVDDTAAATVGNADRVDHVDKRELAS